MVIDTETFKTFQKIGKILAMRGLNTSHSGNISMLSGGKIIIKKRAAMLGWLEPEDLIETPLDYDDSSVMLASSELGVHRAIYKQTDAMAIIHAHTPYLTALSLIEDDITCIDAEGLFLYKKIPVVECDIPIGPTEASILVPEKLKDYPCCVVRSHGAFARGTILEDALSVITGCEQSARIRYLTMLSGKPLKRDYSKDKNLDLW